LEKEFMPSGREVIKVKYLITGSAGFVGAHLSSRLAIEGHTVLGIDNFSPYYSPNFKALRVKELLNPFGVEVRNIDLRQLDLTQDAVRNFQPDVIIHLAAQPGVRTPMEQSYEYIQNNLGAFSNILQTAVECKIPEFLYASSSSVYGNSTKIPYREDDVSIRPISIYGATKLANEILAPTFVDGSKTRARGMRFFTVYGPWGRPDMAYFRLIDSVLNGSQFKKFGGGEIKRDFTYIDDITISIQRLSDELANHPEGYSDIVNIGGGNPHSLNDLISLISVQLGGPPTVAELNSNPNDTEYTSADVSRLRQLSKITPTVDLASGVESTIKWARQVEIRNQLSAWVRSTN
jgi:UDP-glucuronate 4-epimerase